MEIENKSDDIQNLSIGEKVRFFRKRQRMSQLELDTAAKIGVGAISKIESGKRSPKPGVLYKISVALNLDAKELSLLLGLNFYTDDLVVEIDETEL